MSEKIQKLISAAGLMSRRKAESIIMEGRVTVNGVICSIGDRASTEDIICVDGIEILKKATHIYIMLNKPAGYVTTLSDEKGRKNVSQLLEGIDRRVYPVGRLDMFSEGLLLFTDDGDFANKLMHPSNGTLKQYYVVVTGVNIAESVRTMKSICEIDGKTIKPAEIKIISCNGSSAELSIIIHEGRNRQIRKMCESSKLKVKRLVRVREGALELGELQSGLWRYLTDGEIAAAKGEVSE